MKDVETNTVRRTTAGGKSKSVPPATANLGTGFGYPDETLTEPFKLAINACTVAIDTPAERRAATTADSHTATQQRDDHDANAYFEDIMKKGEL